MEGAKQLHVRAGCSVQKKIKEIQCLWKSYFKKTQKTPNPNRIHSKHRLFQTHFCYIPNKTPLITLCVDLYLKFQHYFSSMKVRSHTHARRDYFGKFSSDAAPNPPHLPPLSPCTWFQIEHSPDVIHYLTWGLCPRKCIHSKQALIVSWISFIHVFKLNPSVFTLKWSKTAATSLILEISPLRWALVNSWINWHSKSWYLPGEERDNTKNPSGYVIQAKTVILTVLLTSLIIF